MPTALVTGASHGLGEAFAREIADRGFSVVMVARDAGRLAAAAEGVGRATGAIVEMLVADLTAPAGLAAVERRITQDALPVELLVNSTGAVGAAAVRGTTWAAAGAMATRGRGGILVVAGVGEHGLRVPEFAGSVASTVRGRGVRVTATVVGGTPAGKHATAVARRALDDLDRRWPRSGPDLMHRAIGWLESSWSAVRSAVIPCAEPPARASGDTRPSPVPTPFLPERPRPASAAGPAVAELLPAEPARLTHVTAGDRPARAVRVPTG